MERLDKIASHDGIVKKASAGYVTVEIASTSACASCAAHAKCGFAESKNKTMDIPTSEWANYSEGQAVVVNIDQSRGMLAVWLAYVLPALIMLAVILGLSYMGAAEWVVALAALAILGAYVAILYFLRSRLERKFNISISPKTH